MPEGQAEVGLRGSDGKGGYLVRLLRGTPREDGSNADEACGFSLMVTSLNFYVKISQHLMIALNLFRNTVLTWIFTKTLNKILNKENTPARPMSAVGHQLAKPVFFFLVTDQKESQQ